MQLNDISFLMDQFQKFRIKSKPILTIDFLTHHTPRGADESKNRQHFNVVYQLSSSVEIKRMKKK